jgi:hypothetical protein
MDTDGRLATKSIEQAQEDSIQHRATREAQGRLPLLLFMHHAGEIIAPWWSKKRDLDLDRFSKQCDHYSGAVYVLTSKLSSVPFRIEPRDATVARWRKLAEEYQYRLEAESEFGQGWQLLIIKWLIDLYNQDNGAFLEVIGGGPKDGPIKGLPVGVAHLDSQRCTRTGSAKYPVIYEDTDGKSYMLHRSRVLFRSQQPSQRADMYDVGLCWLSRCINTAQGLTDVLVYKQEKLGSRPKRAIGIARGGLDGDTINEALMLADSVMDAQGLRRYSKIPFVGDEAHPDADVEIRDMASLPDGFDYEQDVTLGMFTIALAGAVPPRWLWPATTTGATKADAMYQHVAGLTGGPGATLQMIATMLAGPERGNVPLPTDVPRFLPPQLRMVFDFQDDEQDRTEAEISKTRAETRERDINTGVVTVPVARAQMVKDGELTEDEFEAMELDEGRTPEGEEVVNLFYSLDPDFQALLDVGVDDPLAVLVNDPVVVLAAIEEAMLAARDILTNATSVSERSKARQALAALGRLKELYLEQAMGEGELEGEEGTEGEKPEGEEEQAEEVSEE